MTKNKRTEIDGNFTNGKNYNFVERMENLSWNSVNENKQIFVRHEREYRTYKKKQFLGVLRMYTVKRVFLCHEREVRKDPKLE